MLKLYFRKWLIQADRSSENGSQWKKTMRVTRGIGATDEQKTGYLEKRMFLLLYDVI